MRFSGAELAGHSEPCPRRHDIVNGETELPRIKRRFPAQPKRFEQDFGSQFEFHRNWQPNLYCWDRQITRYDFFGSAAQHFRVRPVKIISRNALARARIIVAKAHAPIVSRFLIRLGGPAQARRDQLNFGRASASTEMSGLFFDACRRGAHSTLASQRPRHAARPRYAPASPACRWRAPRCVARAHRRLHSSPPAVRRPRPLRPRP